MEIDKYTAKNIFNYIPNAAKTVYVFFDSGLDLIKRENYIIMAEKYQFKNENVILSCCYRQNKDILLKSKIFQNYEDTKHLVTIDFMCVTIENNLLNTLKDKNLVIQNLLRNDNLQRNMNFSITLKLITFVQDKSDNYHQIYNYDVSWIHHAYDYYLLYFINSFLHPESNVFKKFRNFQLYKCFLQPNTEFNYRNIMIYFISSQPNNKNENFISNTDNLLNGENHHENTNNIENNNGNNNNRENNFVRDVMAAGNDRDWLDNFYLLSRIIILFSIVYFYSSPLRFIVVTFIGFLIYLYHNGFFRVQPTPVPDNEVNVENIRQNNNDPPIIRQPNRTVNTNQLSRTDPNVNYINERRPNIFSFIWIFFSSFFASLVPDQPNVM